MMGSVFFEFFEQELGKRLAICVGRAFETQTYQTVTI